jgi:plastocyanin
MNRKYVAFFAIPAAAALVFAATALSRSSTAIPTLKGVVGPGFTISLKKGSKPVQKLKLKTGKYRFVISDKSSIHNFTVEREKPSSPKIEKHVTSSPFTGSKTMVITLKPGSWRYYCSVHEIQMHHDFKVVK